MVALANAGAERAERGTEAGEAAGALQVLACLQERDECAYHHPVSPCKAFPNCKFAEKCLSVYPNCK